MACSAGRSTVMVLLAGQYDAGGLGLAPAHDDAASVPNVSCGGLAGVNVMVIASTIIRTDSSVTGTSPVSSCCSCTGSSPRRCSISLASMDLHDPAPSVNPNWNAEIRSNAEPCS